MYEKLWQAGVREMLCVTPPDGEIAPGSPLRRESMGKAPGVLLPSGQWGANAGWVTPREVPLEEVERWVGDWVANVGLRAARFPALDVDSLDAKLTSAILEFAKAKLGASPVRVGRAPKALVLYRLAEGSEYVTKRVAVVRGPDGQEHRVEFLGRGQQYVIYGTHPSGKPYQWVDAGVISEITKQQVDEFYEELHSALPEGYEVVVRGSAKEREREVDPDTLRAPSMEAVRALVERLPNPASATREDWLTVGYAIFGALPDHPEDGFDIWWEWSQRWEGGGNSFEYCRNTWRGMRDPRVGWDWLEAREREVLPKPDGRDLFEADIEEPDFGMRLAALAGSSRAFIREIYATGDADLGLRRQMLVRAESELAAQERELRERVRLHTAALRKDRVEFLERDLLMEEIRVRIRADEKIPAVDRELATVAVYARLVPMSELSLADGKLPLAEKVMEQDWLVEGMIPPIGVCALIGAPGTAKSHVALALSQAVGTKPGKDPEFGDILPEFAEAKIMRRGAVLYFAGEDVNGVLRRLQRRDPKGEASVYVVNGVPNLNSLRGSCEAVADVLDRLKTPEHPALIVIDMLFHAMSGEEDSVNAMRSPLLTATVIAKVFKTAVLLIHHSRKANAKGGDAETTQPTLYDSRGSSALPGIADWVGGTWRDEDGRVFYLGQLKNKAAELDRTPMVFHFDDRGVLTYGRPPAVPDGHLKLQTAVFIAETLETRDPKKGGMTQAALVTALRERFPNLKRTTAYERVSAGLKHAEQEGWVVWLDAKKVVRGIVPLPS